MFTGIVREQGRVRQVTERDGGRFFLIGATETVRDLALGDSVAVNGVCLTVTRIEGDGFGTEATGETFTPDHPGRPPPGRLGQPGACAQVCDRLGGHLVTGHVDSRCRLLKQEKQGNAVVLEVWVPPEFRKYIINKGSVALDGVSLTVAGKTAAGFRVVIIPHTGRVTTLLQRKPGEEFNLESDYLVKCVEALLAGEGPDGRRGKRRGWREGLGLQKNCGTPGFMFRLYLDRVST